MVRDTAGRFLKGHAPTNNGKGGRKPRSHEERYLEILRECVGPNDWRDIINKAREQAARGDDKARKWLSDYILGRPVETVKADVTTEVVTLELSKLVEL